MSTDPVKEKEERAAYKIKLREINLNLSVSNLQQLPDLTSDLSSTTLLKTVRVISQILEDRTKLVDSKNEILQKLTKLESDQNFNSDKFDALNLKIKDLNNKIEFFKNKLSLQEKKYEKETDKLAKDKEELQKAFNKISMKESQYKHEVKKLESIIEETKVKLKKYMNDNKEIKISDTKNERILVNNNAIVFDNFLKNSPSIILNQVNYSKDFYSLIFKSFNEKLNIVVQENKDLRECLKFLRDEITQYIEIKKTVLYQLCQDSLLKEGIQSKDCSGLINNEIFNLDFATGKSDILEYFNEIIDNFRFLLIYDFYKIEPSKEFTVDEIRNTFKNNKFSLENIPYFKQISATVERLNLDKLNEVKANIEKRMKTEAKRKFSDDLDINIPEVRAIESTVQEQLEDINNDIDANIENMEEVFKNAEEEILDYITQINNDDFNGFEEEEHQFNQ